MDAEATSAVTTYLDACQQVGIAYRKAKRLGDRLSAVHASIDGCWTQELGPTAICLDAVDIESLPTRQEVSTAADRFNVALREMQQAWDRIPPEFKHGLVPPASLTHRAAD